MCTIIIFYWSYRIDTDQLSVRCAYAFGCSLFLIQMDKLFSNSNMIFSCTDKEGSRSAGLSLVLTVALLSSPYFSMKF